MAVVSSEPLLGKPRNTHGGVGQGRFQIHFKHSQYKRCIENRCVFFFNSLTNGIETWFVLEMGLAGDLAAEGDCHHVTTHIVLDHRDLPGHVSEWGLGELCVGGETT